MNHGVSFFKLAGPRGDGINPYLNEEGAFLGDGTALLTKDKEGRWRPRNRSELELRLAKEIRAPSEVGKRMDRLPSLCKALDKGDFALASIELVLMQLPAISNEPSNISKYRPDQPRAPVGQSDGGQWTDDASSSQGYLADKVSPVGAQSPDFIDVAYNGAYHDQVVAWLAKAFSSQGVTTETNVPLTSIDGKITAIADLMIKTPIVGNLFVIEVKTGNDPTYTISQAAIYPMASIGGHVFSASPKIAKFGFLPLQPLPPLQVDVVYAAPGEELSAEQLFPQFVKMEKEFSVVSLSAL